MPRNFYIWLAAAVVIVGAGLVVYRTSPGTLSDISESAQAAEFGDVSLRIEYATTSITRERGLGGRASIPDNYGMLFVFPKDALYGFWMRDTLVPLDIFWLGASAGGGSASGGQGLSVVSFMTDVLPSSYPHVFYPTASARYVLETVAGFARAHRIKNGTPLLLKNLPPVSE